MMDGSIHIVGSNLESQQNIENEGDGKCFFVKVLEDSYLAAVHPKIESDDEDSDDEDSEDEDSEDEDDEDEDSEEVDDFQFRIFDLNSQTWSTPITDQEGLSNPKSCDSDNDEETERQPASIPRGSEIKFFGLYLQSRV